MHLISATDVPIGSPALAEMRRYCSAIEVVSIPRAQSIVSIARLGPLTQIPFQVLYFNSDTLRKKVAVAVERSNFDVLHAMTVRIAPAVFDVKNVPIVVDFMDSFAANLATRRETAGFANRLLYESEYRRVAPYERRIARRAAAGFVIAERDRQNIGERSLTVIPNGVELDEFQFNGGERDHHTLIFTGNMGYEPNIDAVTWFASECFPALRAAEPRLRFQIVGARPAPQVLALGRLPGIEVTGYVESVVPFLQRATVAVCPVRCGSGMQNKLLEAMATGVPVVTTDFANRGVNGVAGREVQVAADAESFTAAVMRLIRDPALRATQAATAYAAMQARYSWDVHARAVTEVYEHAIASRSPRSTTESVSQ